MIFFPRAKINLGLRITGKREDGYHDIQTIFYPAGLCDILEFVVSSGQEEKDILDVTGIDIGDAEDNLVYKAILRLRDEYEFPYLKIHLHKLIPAGAGLGGGSSDAAAILKAVDKCFNLALGKDKLKAIALELGSDCPFFIDSVPVLASGRGEIMEPVRPFLTGYHIVIVNPGVGINTGEAYRNCKPAMPSSSLSELAERPVAEWKKLILNDFEDFAFKKYPLIENLKDEMYIAGASFSLMSGSGSSVYGLFAKKPEISEKLKKYLICQGLI